MYIKLNFTQNKTAEQVFRILADIINNADTITSISALTSRFTSTYTSTEIQAGFDSANSELIVTSPINTSLTRAHICRPTAVADAFQFTLQQSVYDSTSTKYYTRIYADRAAGALGTTNTIPYTSHATSGNFVCSATTLAPGDRITITGTYGGTGSISGYVSGNTYQVISVVGTSPSVTGFTLAAEGNLIIPTTAAGTATGLTFLAHSPVNITVGDASSPAFSTSLSMPITTASRTAAASGTALTLSNTYTPAAFASAAATGEYMNMQNICVRTLWCYITDKTFLLGFNGLATSTLGWSTTVATNTVYTSSSIFVSQYTRLDGWNSSSNGVIPVIWTKPRAAYSTIYNSNYGAGLFSSVPDYQYIWSVNNTSTYHLLSVPCLLLNSYNTTPSSNSTTLTKLYNQFVPHGIGLKSTEQQPIQGASTIDPSASALSGISCSSLSSATTSAGAPNATLTTRTYHLHPITWSHTAIAAFGGGNVSEQAGFYVYTGDYQPGDEFSYGGTTYSIWPSGAALPVTSRIGIAVPKL